MSLTEIAALLPPWGWIVAAAVLGLVVGSFLNVVIVRLPERMQFAWRSDARDVLALAPEETPPPPDLVFAPSHCPHCQHPLGAHDNIPLLAWLLLRGRCRYCRARISIQYPLVELAGAVAAVLVMIRFGPGLASAAGLLLAWALIALSGIDIRTGLLPDPITLPLMWLGLLVSLKAPFVSVHMAVLGAATGYLSLWSVHGVYRYVTGKEGMGHGDFKLLAALGAWMGPFAILPIVMGSSLLGLLIGGGLMLARRQDLGTRIPFGPFIALAGMAWFLTGHLWMQAYLHLPIAF